jgi:hypothetical protein
MEKFVPHILVEVLPAGLIKPIQLKTRTDKAKPQWICY